MKGSEAARELEETKMRGWGREGKPPGALKMRTEGEKQLGKAVEEIGLGGRIMSQRGERIEDSSRIPTSKEFLKCSKISPSSQMPWKGKADLSSK